MNCCCNLHEVNTLYKISKKNCLSWFCSMKVNLNIKLVQNCAYSYSHFTKGFIDFNSIVICIWLFYAKR